MATVCDALYAISSLKPITEGTGTITPLGTYPLDFEMPRYLTLMLVPKGTDIDQLYAAFCDCRPYSHRWLANCNYGGIE